jgi:hypothetical protein
MATDEQLPPLPLEVRGHSAFAIATGEKGPTGTSKQPIIPTGLNGSTGPSVTNADTFVPNQMWEPPPVRRRPFALDQSGFGFDQGTFDSGTFEAGIAAGLNVEPIVAQPQGAAVVALAGSLSADATETVTRSSAGSTRVENRDAILIKSTTVRLLLSATIDRARTERSNSAGISELEAILAAVDDLHEMVSTTTAFPSSVIDAKVDTFKKGVLGWWDHDHVQILSNSFNGALFAALMELSAQVGLVQAVTIATILKGKDIVEALKALAKILHGPD